MGRGKVPPAFLGLNFGKRRYTFNKFKALAWKILLIANFLFLAGTPSGSLAVPLNGKDSPYQPAVILGKEDNGREIQVRAGDVIQVNLEGLGGAGFWWYVEGLDSMYWELIGEETRGIEQSRIGGPMLGQWFFRAKKEGMGEIKMDYYRKWEGQHTSADTFRIKLLIQ